MAAAVHPVRSIAARLAIPLQRWFKESVEELGAYEFRLKFRAGLGAGSWRRHGEELFGECAGRDQPVLLAIDELPKFLKRMLRIVDDVQRVDEFLSWLRQVLLRLSGHSLVVIISGSIGLQPLAQQLGIPDRINYLYPYRLGPWSREDCIECFHRLANSYEISLDPGVAETVYDSLGVSIPYQVQTFFALLRDFATMQGRDQILLQEVNQVYHHELLGPSGHNYLVHYETRLRDGLGDDKNHAIAMEILAEAATQGAFTEDARRGLHRLYSSLVPDAPARIAGVMDVLEHDGYLRPDKKGDSFESKLLEDWWRSRFREHHIPILNRGEGNRK